MLYPLATDSDAQCQRVIAAGHVEAANRMLAATIANGTGKKAAIADQAAGKTGTTQQYRDAWFVGYTSALVTGIWTGHDNNKPVPEMTGGKLPAQLWAAFMQEALKNRRVAGLPGLPSTPLPPSRNSSQ